MSSTDVPVWSVLFADDYVLAVTKAPGVPVQPDLTNDVDLLTLVRSDARFANAELVNRIDRPVSGIVLFALEAEALRSLNAMFKERKITKHYWAIVEGSPDAAGVLEHHLMHDAKARKARAVHADMPREELSRLRFRCLAKGDRFSLLEVEPEGGAFHQIRAQLSAAGHPIKGDVKYGARRGEKDRSIGLHARSLAFEHPILGAAMQFEAPTPATGIWSALIQLTKSD